jgi:hypothetical protein
MKRHRLKIVTSAYHKRNTCERLRRVSASSTIAYSGVTFITVGEDGAKAPARQLGTRAAMVESRIPPVLLPP